MLKYTCTIFFLVCFYLVACTPQDIPAPTSVTTFGAPSILPTSTPTLITAQSLIDLTRSPTQIFVPTLSKEDALKTFEYLIKDGNECLLPCWLGVTPGQTMYKDVENIFLQYNELASTKFSPQRASVKVFFPEFETASYEITTDIKPEAKGVVSWILVNAIAYQDRNGPLNYKNQEFQTLLRRYFITEVFTRYGLPDKIFLDTTLIAADTSITHPFVLWVVYQQPGFLIRYEGINTKVEDRIRICPMQSKLEIKIWNVENGNFNEFIQGDRALGLSTSLGPQPIESVTEFDIESFYKIFKNGDLNTCFETPIEIWPH